MSRMDFAPISIEKYVKTHIKNNRGENPVTLRQHLRSRVKAAVAGAHCDCGEPIWVIGSVWAGNACFTCITGEADPSEDYEIDEVLSARRASLGREEVQGRGQRR